MKDVYRHNIFRLFALFFVVMTPFLAIFSLGFDPDFSGGSGSLNHTMAVTVETFPGSSVVAVDGTEVMNQNGEFKTRDGAFVPISITQEGYISEEFSVWSRRQTNSLAKITPLYLLPAQSDQVASFADTQPDILEIVDEDIVLFGSSEQYFISQFDVNGQRGEQLAVENPGNLDLAGDVWESLREDAYWSIKNQALLLQSSDGWQLVSVGTSIVRVAGVVQIDDRFVLLHTDTQQVWLHDLETDEMEFIDAGVTGLTFTDTPDVVWVWKGDTILRFTRNLEVISAWDASMATTYSQPRLLQLPQSSYQYSVDEPARFVVKNAFQGVVFFVDSFVYYVPDAQPDQWIFVASDVMVFAVDSSTLFWHALDGSIFARNLSEEFDVLLGNIAFQGAPREQSLFYFNSWKRLFVYSPSSISSVWFDKNTKADSPSAATIGYHPQTWVRDAACYREVVDRLQFCIHNTSIDVYRNQFLTPIF